MSDLFKPTSPPASDAGSRPLADRMRPASLAEVVGQGHLTEPGGLLHEMAMARQLPSLLFWGPPGAGKTTLAHVMATVSGAHFVAFSAVLGGVKEVRQIVAEATQRLARDGQATVLFVDEIHRFSKSQQDAFLPHVEKGTIVLVGATTENPSFEVNAALLSRCTVVRLHPLGQEAVADLLRRAVRDKAGLDGAVEAADEALVLMAGLADGDARRALNLLEQAAWVAEARQGPLTEALVREVFKKQPLRHDKGGDDHYDAVSAFIKSLRGSSPDGALYWMVRLLEAGEDPLFVARRLVIFASEDVGNADPRALSLALAAFEAVRRVGLPEGRIPLAQTVTYLASAPKSNASYLALRAAEQLVKMHGSDGVPLHLRNAPTRLLKELGAGAEYRYPHDFPGGYAPRQRYLPEGLEPSEPLYQPRETGYEKHIRALMQWRRELDEDDQ